MKKRLLCLFIGMSGFFVSKSFAQNVAINEDGSAANPNAILDIKSFTKGILIPRLSTTGRLGMPNVMGMLVFDTTDLAFYYNLGSAGWQKLATTGTANPGEGWSLNGNVATATNFLGTTNNVPFKIKVNNTFSGLIDPVSFNTFFGYQTGGNSTGSFNTATGARALSSNTTGLDNTGIGYLALFQNTSGIGNTAVGAQALSSNIDGSENTAIGKFSLRANTSGGQNTAIGEFSLLANTTGYSNTAMGHSSLRVNTTGFNNNAMGENSLLFNTTGFENTAIGLSSLESNTTGSFNTASGNTALYHNTTGGSNTAFGLAALRNNSVGSDNTAVGTFALSNTTGSKYNVAIGFAAGYNYNMGWNNTLIGSQADVDTLGIFNSVAVGNLARATGSNQVRLGNAFTISIGGYANWTNISDGRFKKNIQENVKGLDFIMKLRPVTYQLDITGISKKLNEGGGKEKDEFSKKAIAEKEKAIITGFVAQEVEKAAKESGYNFSGVDVPKTENEFYGLRYSEFVVPLVKAVQEQQKLITELQKQVAELQLQMQHSK